MVSYLTCFNSIKLAVLNKRQNTYIKITTKNEKILSLLAKYNIVVGYNIVHYFGIDYYLVHINKHAKHFHLKNLLKITKPRYIRIKDIIKLNNKNTHTSYILCTSKGFLNIKEALNLNIGGVLIFRIF